ncbi:MAG: serine acetyltransferase, partial [Candidatus Accumulibacter sp.]|nr:serine acetyltransferase [Accumulibacter sp.]
MNPKEFDLSSFDFLGVDSSYWGLEDVVTELREARKRWRAQQRRRDSGMREFPSRKDLKDISEAFCAVLFPMRLGPPDLQHETEDYYVGHTLNAALRRLYQQIRLELAYQSRREGGSPNADRDAAALVKTFAAGLPSLRILLDLDVEAAFRGDPAARSVDEILLSYPGVQAIIHHRLAHSLFNLGAPLVARIVAEISHSATGIDIHPGAQIGS